MNDYDQKAATAAEVMWKMADKKTESDRRLEEARLAQIRFDYLDRVQQGQVDTRRRYAHERYLG